MRGMTGGTYKQLENGDLVQVAEFVVFPDNKQKRKEHKPFKDPYPHREINLNAGVDENVMPPAAGVIAPSFEDNEDDLIDAFEVTLTKEEKKEQRTARREARKKMIADAAEAEARATAEKIKEQQRAAGIETQPTPPTGTVNTEATKVANTPVETDK